MEPRDSRSGGAGSRRATGRLPLAPFLDRHPRARSRQRQVGPLLAVIDFVAPVGIDSLSLDGLDSEEAAGKPVFAVPLSEAITYASITISTPGPNGDFFVWGVVPTVVARWYVLARFLASARVWLTLSFAALGTMVDPAGGTSKRKLLRSKAHFEFRVAQSE